MSKIGIMGGTFDPIHIGHLIIAENALHQLKLDKVLFMPAGNPPHKMDRTGRATDHQRVKMIRMAIAGNPSFELSLREMEEDRISYTYLTLEDMKREKPEDELYFIIGADSLYDFHTWKEPGRICAKASIVVAARNTADESYLDREIEMNARKYKGNFVKLKMHNIDISSHDIRHWIRHDRSIRYYVPEDVRDYIYSRKIYKNEE